MPQRSKALRSSKLYRNPVILAQEWQQALGNRDHSSQADFARRQGVSRARVTQVLQLLNLAPDVLITIAGIGDPLPSRIITERMLRTMVHHSADEQRQEINRILVKGRNPRSDAAPLGYSPPARRGDIADPMLP
jgi:hypothetical protein